MYCYYVMATPDSPKLRALLRKKPLLSIIRDPIERLQHAINHLQDSYNHLGANTANIYAKNLNLTCDYHIKPNALYEGNSAKPNLDLLNLDVSYRLNRLSLYDST